jgi:hypothetical protein
MDESHATKKRERELIDKLGKAADAIAIYNRRKWDIDSDIRDGVIYREEIERRIAQSEECLEGSIAAQDGTDFNGTWVKLEEFWGEELEKWKNHEKMK